jgi:hypothetical protein
MKFSRLLRFCAGMSVLQLCLSGNLQSQKAPEGISWSFDESAGAVVHDSLGNLDDRVDGFWSRVPGLPGKALEFDGYSTRIVRVAKNVPPLGDRFSVSACVALNNYPWNWVPIADQSAESQVGYFFGIDAFGHVGFDVAVNGVWQQLISSQKLPLKKWARLSGTFDSKSGMTIYINGEVAATLQATGHFAQAVGADLIVGRVRAPMLPFPAWLIHPQDPVKYSLDGNLDEVKILNHSINPDEEKTAFAESKIPDRDVIPYAVLPSGPSGAGPFGALYATLKFTPTWDRPRRLGPDSDVVVRFDHSPMRLVFWQGTNYVPAWVTNNGKWYTDEFLEAWGPQCVDGEDCEPMSDKQSRYSHVSILESSPARAVVHWRYALAETRNYKGAFTDPVTGWFDWANEYWYVYPDGVAVRKQVLWSSDLDPKEPAGHEWQETIVINGPGQRPEDNIEADALTFLNMKGETHTYHWDPKTDESFDYPKGPGTIDLPTGANIQVVNLKSTEKAFQIVWPRGTHFDSYNGEKSYSMFEAWNHWPVAQIASSGRPAVAADRTSHTSLSHIYWDEYGKDEQTETKLLLSGLTSLSPSQLLPLAKSWISPPAVKVVEGDSAGAEYDPSQRAFVVHRSATAKAGGLTLKLAASAETPIVNPAFVIENWSGPVKVTVSRKGGKWDVPVRIGYSTRLESVSLVLYMGLTSNEETQVRVDPALK